MLGKSFNDDQPLFIQIKERIESQILQGVLKEDEQIPSTTQIVQFYKINHLTVSKGINLLVDEGIVYKKRGIGMFVSPGAKEKLQRARQASFKDDYVKPLTQEAQNLGLEEKQVLSLVKEAFEDVGTNN